MKKILLLLAILLFASVGGPVARAAVDYKNEGKRLCQLGQYEEALPYLEKAVKQNRKSGALWYMAITLQHLYDFDGALETAETYRTVLNSEDWLNRADSLISVLNICRRAFDHTQDVVIIDSMLVDRDTFFRHYQLGAESGRIQQGDQGIYYENQAADYHIVSDGHQLLESHKFQNRWEEAHPLPGIGATDCTISYPFMRSDGETLFFASDSIPGMGGLDIYRTSYNAEEGSYYQPERLGMPFNSPYNDYMLAIDETNQVGWWATDRSATDDKVMIYLFLYEDDPNYLDEPTASRARIDCIAETWRQEEGYAELVNQLMAAPQTPVIEAPKLHIVIGDNKVYSSVDQFRNPQALAAYQQSESLGEKIASLEQTIAEARCQYHGANSKDKQTLATRLQKAEETLLSLYQQQREAVLLYRRLEQ